MALSDRDALTPKQLDELRESVAKRLEDASLPTLPLVAVSILELMGDETAGMGDFEKVISTDQGLSAKILKLVNSAAYAQSRPVIAIQRAAVLLGLEKIKALSLGFHIASALQSDEGQAHLKTVWSGSLMRAWIGLRIAELVDKSCSGEAFVAALLSDAGMTVMPRLVGSGYFDAIGAVRPNAYARVEWERYGVTHVDAIVAVCRLWKLPIVLTDAVAGHHEPARPVVGGDRASIVRAVASLVGRIELMGASEDPVPSASLRKECTRVLGVEAGQISKAFELAIKDHKSSLDLFADLVDTSVDPDELLGRSNAYLSQSLIDILSEHDGGVLRFVIDGQAFEIEPRTEFEAAIFMIDADGVRVMTQTVEIDSLRPELLRDLFMLEDASEGEIDRLLELIRAAA